MLPMGLLELSSTVLEGDFRYGSQHDIHGI